MPDWLSKIVISILALLSIAIVWVSIDVYAFSVEQHKVQTELIANAPQNSPFLREFEGLFSDAEHKIESGKHLFPNGERRSVKIWYCKAWLYGRHAIGMSFPFETKEDGTINLLAEPDFSFSSLAESGIDEEGLWFRLGESRSFKVRDWKRLVDAGGDFSVLGLTVTEGSPVEHFEQWKQY